MRISTSMRWLVVALSAAMLLAVVAACAGETVEVPGETVVVKEEVVKTVEVPGETVVVEREVIKTVEVPGETVTKEVVKEVMVPGETVVVEKEVVKTVEVPGETVVKEVVKTVEVPGETVVVEKEVVKTVEVPGETVVVEKVVVQEVRAGYVTDPTTGKVVSAPEYGGTFTTALGFDPAGGVDIAVQNNSQLLTPVLEKLVFADWGIDRDVFDFRVTSYTPEVAFKGSLAESWETPDPLTTIFHIRKGVYWHDKAPMNGRELTAYDVEYNFHRMTGMGSGYTEPPPQPPPLLGLLSFESITATDKWTLVIKLKEPYIGSLGQLIDAPHTWIYPPEVIEQYGAIYDWRHLVGTGAYELVDYIEDSYVRWDKNPAYWGYDEKYPENRLPYIDQIEGLLIFDPATRLAAMRTGKIDALFAILVSGANLDDLESLTRTNPEVVASQYYQRSNHSFSLNVTEPPFDDIRVRHAMQMALDLEAINNAIWKGLGSITPQGILRAEYYPASATPFEEWPEEIQGYYTYDPAGAEALLDTAGYTRGADGIRFKTNMDTLDWGDLLDYHQAAADYLAKIGVEVDIQVTALANYGAWAARFKDQGYGGMGYVAQAEVGSPLVRVREYHSTLGRNLPGSNDPAFDALVEAAIAATTLEEQQRLLKEAGMRATEQHWVLWGPMSPDLMVVQPWVIGYSGEIRLAAQDQTGAVWARIWIDSELKEAMGY